MKLVRKKQHPRASNGRPGASTRYAFFSAEPVAPLVSTGGDGRELAFADG
jgi:hypothetical protein